MWGLFLLFREMYIPPHEFYMRSKMIKNSCYSKQKAQTGNFPICSCFAFPTVPVFPISSFQSSIMLKIELCHQISGVFLSFLDAKWTFDTEQEAREELMPLCSQEPAFPWSDPVRCWSMLSRCCVCCFPLTSGQSALRWVLARTRTGPK